MGNAPHHVVIGLIGGVAAGKSTVARMFADLGARVIDADAVGHEALSNEHLRGEIEKVFTARVLDDFGKIDRKKLGQEVFGNREKLAQLNAITHPWIRKTIADRLCEFKEQGNAGFIVLDVSLLLESGAYDEVVDRLVFIETRDELRDQRAVRDRDWQEGEVNKRQRHQLSLEEKRNRADFVISNDGDLNHLRAEVKRIWKDISERAESASES